MGGEPRDSVPRPPSVLGTPPDAERLPIDLASFSVSETARLIGMTESGVRRMLERGDLRAARDHRGRLRVMASEIDRYRQKAWVLSQQPNLFDERDRDIQGFPSAPLLRRATEELDDYERQRLERTITELRREVARLRGAIESLLVADGAKRDALSQLLLEEGNWAQ